MDLETPSLQLGRFLLVDGHAYAYRAFYAIRELSGPDGQPTNAIFGFAKMLSKLQERLNPTHLLVIWDAGLDAKRTELLPEYKAQRPTTPASLEAQFPQILDYLRASAISSLAVEGIEADDLIGAYSLSAASSGWDVIIASSDKDFMQLVRPGIRLINPGDKLERLWTATEVEQKTGVQPSQIVDYLSLVGDSVDNINGVPGIGPKTAVDLLHQFGNIDGMLGGVANIASARIRSAVDSSREVLRRNQQLVGLRTELPLPLPVADCRIGTFDFSELYRLYSLWGFHSMRNDLETRGALQPALL